MKSLTFKLFNDQMQVCKSYMAFWLHITKRKRTFYPISHSTSFYKIKTLCRVRIKKSKLIPLHFFMKLNVSMHTQPYIANAFILVIGKCTFFDVAVYRYNQKHNYFIKRFSWEIYEYGRNWGTFEKVAGQQFVVWKKWEIWTQFRRDWTNHIESIEAENLNIFWTSPLSKFVLCVRQVKPNFTLPVILWKLKFSIWFPPHNRDQVNNLF